MPALRAGGTPAMTEPKRPTPIPCPSCQQDTTDHIPVWEDPTEYNSGNPPDFLGCVECNSMLPYDEWWPPVDSSDPETLSDGDSDTGGSNQ